MWRGNDGTHAMNSILDCVLASILGESVHERPGQ